MLRIFDIIISVFALLFGLPVFIFIYLLGLIDTGSPLFLQKRIGKNQEVFTLIKFRTMKPETASVGTHLVDRDSITKLGHFLRRTKLDELPQLINVLFGQMSLVGPRPCLPNQKKLILERQFRGVFSIRPGITGLAQVQGIDMSTPRKLARYDQLMIRKMTLNLYFKLILATGLGKGNGDRIQH